MPDIAYESAPPTPPTPSLECVETSDRTERISRRGLTRRVTLVGMASAFVAGLSSLLTPTSANAAYCAKTGEMCCNLAECKECNYAVAKNRFTCPSGYHRTYWTCVSSGKTVYCGECAHGTNCDAGPWACSIWYTFPGA